MRHVRVRGGLGIKDKTIITEDIVDKAITTAKGSPYFITTSLMGSVITVGGSVVRDGYLDYSPISTVKGAVAIPMHDVSGSAPYQHPYIRIASGSVQVKRGSPGGYFSVIVTGDR